MREIKLVKNLEIGNRLQLIELCIGLQYYISLSVNISAMGNFDNVNYSLAFVNFIDNTVIAFAQRIAAFFIGFKRLVLVFPI